ncbi:MAG: magnesium transporter [Epsilonproteobacteria bacterium]|nr:magnesium transporter [Campylobacterota bacterium]
MSDKIVNELEILDNFISDASSISIHPSDIAKILKNLKEEDEEKFFYYLENLPDEILGDVLLELPENYLKETIEKLPSSRLAQAIKELESDDATDLIQDIEDVDESKAQRVFSELDEEEREEIKKLSSYEDDEAGAYMQTELFTAKLNEKISDAINRLKRLKEEGKLENIHQVYLVDEFGRLLTTISLEDLIVFDFDKSFKEVLGDHIQDSQLRYAKDTDKIEDVLHMFEEYDLSALPVVDKDGKLVGRITSDDIYDLIEESATEQIYNLAGVSDEAEHEDNILKTGKNRAIWLFINLGTAILASLVIGIFEGTIQKYVALAVLMPIVASMGGNAGTQTLTVVVRQLALGEIDKQNAKKALKKEIIIALVNGILFAFVMALIAFIWFKDVKLGYVIALAMVINLLAAGFFGALIPLILKKLNIDPAVGSTVLLTTVTDVVGFFAFLGLAKLLLLNN